MICIIGTGGHAKVITDIFKRKNSDQNLTFFTSSPPIGPPFTDNQILDDHPHTLSQFHTAQTYWHVAIGNPGIRKKKIESLSALRLPIISAIHDQSVLAKHTQIKPGTSVMAGAVINPYTTIGKASIINTLSSIDHDCQIADFVNIGPGCRLAGGVKIGELTELGTGATVIPNIKIGSHSVIGAGAVVTSDIPDFSLAVGVPATIKPLDTNHGR